MVRRSPNHCCPERSWTSGVLRYKLRTAWEKLTLPFKAELQAEPRRIFIHQAAKLSLALSADLPEASSVAYTVRDVAAPTGSLVLASSGETLTTGSPLAFGRQHLLFQYTGERGSETIPAPIKITVSNEQGELREATVVLELKPVTFQVNTWFRQPTNEECNLMEGEFSVLEIALTGVDEQLHDDPWKLIAWHCSDGITRSLVNSEGEEWREFPLNCTEKNQLYLKLPTLLTGSAPQMSLTIEGPGNTRQEAVAILLDAQQATVARNIAQLLDRTVKANQAADAYLSAPVKGQRYEALQVAKQATERELAKLQAAADNIKECYDIQGGSLPQATEEAFYRIIEEAIPSLEKKQEKLEEAYKLWSHALCEIYDIGSGDVESYVESIYKPIHGALAIHSWASLNSVDEKVAQFLMDRTVDINVKNKDGFTALHLASKFKQVESLKTLLHHGANPNIKDINGKTPLMYALELDKDGYEMVSQLLRHGADPNISWPDGEKPLEYATQLNAPWRIVSQLLEHGAEARY